MPEDIIDFNCSPLWLDYYNSRGMTGGRRSQPPPDANQEHITRLLDKQAGLENEIANLRRRLVRQTMQRQAPPPAPAPEPSPPSDTKPKPRGISQL